jgi:ATP dependent DNA ligase domain
VIASTRHGHVFTADALVIAAARSRPRINGELVVCRTAGLDFTALQRRLTDARHAAETPATFVAFDVLAAGDTDLRTHPYRIRRALLLQLLDDAAPPLAVVPMTTDGEAAHVWLTGHLDAGIEGVVAKRLDTATYRSGEPRTPAGDRAHWDASTRRPAGHRRHAAPCRRPAPLPPVLPPARFRDAAPVEYRRVEPTVVVELAVDAAADIVRGRPVWRHPATFHRNEQRCIGPFATSQ